MSKHTADHIFPSEDESSDGVQMKVKTKENKKRKSSPTRSPQPSTSKKGKTVIRPIPPITKSTAREVFGSDSDDDAVDAPAEKKPPMIYSYVTRRLANGFSRQIDENKKGAFYIELKVYKCDEIERIQPVNRWRHSVITIKNKTDEDSESWRHLNEFIISTRREFKRCTPTFISSYQ
ncbi:uncharacterized protein LOC124644833 [Helicoverpa zea]|uniref:uncharacterized protein LOC124634497 n=1 Tax=Helicoverpa zea TaxID=7113 RepID=UPI000B3689C4|nr:uncharacterized protein LOC124634497 [Helicoverpa zea]XP_047036091.1 uncharacterized protein LOC124641883 [Helicoverpa zea]XP_047038568.1 uncharacterized protein LOC124643608 [Helicoverpa zea]XP_047039182.1 uncharacterized protein LOC124644042 [Helicoverpa zea]XP_047039235.1 uncharacterized protein LOC124644073 [Helicoverpa zea]XP_047039898.1 uncharacterized protein LOC124644513 [Helicoverpa zea]XP_047040394.1 uncharacterized protein LOC124644833 [Helicoverpa zea]